MLVILDNTVLTNFAHVNRSDLLFGLWVGAVSTTPAVIAEYRAAVLQGILPPDAWQSLNVLEPTKAEIQLAAQLPGQLGAGERAGLAAAILRQGLFASDDLVARRSAAQHGVALTGTLGILTACVQRGLLTHDDGNLLLARMVAAGYRSPIPKLEPK